MLVPLSRAKTRLYFQVIYTLSTFQNEFKIIVLKYAKQAEIRKANQK